MMNSHMQQLIFLTNNDGENLLNQFDFHYFRQKQALMLLFFLFVIGYIIFSKQNPKRTFAWSKY